MKLTALVLRPEGNTTFCGRLGKDCGAVTAADNCGVSRTVDCGTCTAPRHLLGQQRLRGGWPRAGACAR